MNTMSIKCLLLKLIRRNFVAVVSRDLLDDVILTRYPACVVINTQPANMPGEHWVCLWMNSSKNWDFFDSFGQPPEKYKIILKNVSKFNDKILQSDDTTVCGHYCIWYILLRAKGSSHASAVRHMSRIPNRDAHVRNLVERLAVKHQLTQLCNPSSCPAGSQCCTSRFQWCLV